MDNYQRFQHIRQWLYQTFDEATANMHWGNVHNLAGNSWNGLTDINWDDLGIKVYVEGLGYTW